MVSLSYFGDCRDSSPGTSLRAHHLPERRTRPRILPGFISRHFIEGTSKTPHPVATSNCRDSSPGTSLRGLPVIVVDSFDSNCRDSSPGTSLRVCLSQAVSMAACYCRDSSPGTSLRGSSSCLLNRSRSHCRDSSPGTSLRAVSKGGSPTDFNIAGIHLPALH